METLHLQQVASRLATFNQFDARSVPISKITLAKNGYYYNTAEGKVQCYICGYVLTERGNAGDMKHRCLANLPESRALAKACNNTSGNRLSKGMSAQSRTTRTVGDDGTRHASATAIPGTSSTLATATAAVGASGCVAVSSSRGSERLLADCVDVTDSESCSDWNGGSKSSNNIRTGFQIVADLKRQQMEEVWIPDMKKMFSSLEVNTTVGNRIQDQRTKFSGPQSFVKALHRYEDEQDEHPIASESSKYGEQHRNKAPRKSFHRKHNRNCNVKPHLMKNKEDISSPSLVEMQEKKEDWEDERLCKICVGDEATTVLLPCGHLCCCWVCGTAMVNCPVCRSTINQTVRMKLD